MPRVTFCKTQSELKNEFFPRWLKGRLAEKGYAQKDLAEALGWSQQHFSYVIKHNSFHYKDLLEVLHFLGADEEDLKKLMLY